MQNGEARLINEGGCGEVKVVADANDVRIRIIRVDGRIAKVWCGCVRTGRWWIRIRIGIRDHGYLKIVQKNCFWRGRHGGIITEKQKLKLILAGGWNQCGNLIPRR